MNPAPAVTQMPLTARAISPQISPTRPTESRFSMSTAPAESGNPEHSQAVLKRPAVIRIENLVVEYGKTSLRDTLHRAVHGLSLQVHQGEVFGLLGPNGAGKTSTMRMIGAISPVTAGTLRVLGMDPAVDGPRIRARLGVVPQQDTR